MRAELAELLKTTRIVPVAVYPFRDTIPQERLVLSGDYGTYLDFHVISCAIKGLDVEAFKNSPNLVARLCLPLMKRDPNKKGEIVTRTFEGLVSLEPEWERQAKYAKFITDYAGMNNEELQEMRRIHVDRSPHREGIMTLTETLEKIGEARGKKRGEKRGKKLGKKLGEAEGRAAEILALYKESVLPAKKARERLMLLAERGAITKGVADKALSALLKAR